MTVTEAGAPPLAADDRSWVLGVDVGGTFTDGILIEPATGEVQLAKVSSTPDDQSRGTLATLPELGVDITRVAVFSHGTTTGLNALIERAGSRTALICTEGTRDLLDTGRLTRERPEIYDNRWIRPHLARPLVHRRHIREVSARMLSDGSIYVALDEAALRRELEFLRDEGIEAIGVCLMNAHANLEHEARVVELVREVMPEVYVQSSASRPVVGEYSRTSAVVLDAYTGPVVTRYLRRLRDELSERGYTGPTVIMQMNGGLRTLDRTVDTFPAYTIESGPVAGMLGTEYYARSFLDVDSLVAVDIGGSSTDIGLVVEGEAQLTQEWEVEWALPLGMPAVDVRSIGAGGGSILSVDEMGTLSVGPRSAGAQPGPACYGRGGTEPTVTDAHVVMGTLRAEHFLGGRMPLAVDRAHDVIGALATRLEMDPYRLAAGAVQLINANVEAEIRKLVFELGLDPRGFALFGYGGAGGLHVADIARQAGIAEVIVPRMAGGFAALGLATAPAKSERATSVLEELSAIVPEALAGRLAELERALRDDLGVQGIAPEQIQMSYLLFGMYEGQSFANPLAVPTAELDHAVLARWRLAFDAMYDRLYGYSAPELDVTITTVSVTASGPRTELRMRASPAAGPDPTTDALEGRYAVSLHGEEPRPMPFWRRDLLIGGNRIDGPAVIQDDATTILVPDDAHGVIDGYGTVHIHV